VLDIHHENFKLKNISHGRQKPSRFQRTAVAGVLVNLFKQAAGSRLTKRPRTTKRRANTTTSQKIVAAASRPVPFLGMNRTQAADYIGVSPSKFDEMVKDGRMPQPKRIDGRCVWHIRQLDLAFERLPGGADDDRNEWDDALQGTAEKRHGSH
jgi:predicted DNA-binding transcriptional regulator AlpA